MRLVLGILFLMASCASTESNMGRKSKLALEPVSSAPSPQVADDGATHAETPGKKPFLSGLFAKLKPSQDTRGVEKVRDQTYTIPSGADAVWDELIGVLLQDYALSVVDRSAGIVVSEWDSYVLKGQHYRNKLSLRMRRLASRTTELILHNEVEVWASGSGWFAGDQKESLAEVERIVKNTSLALGIDYGKDDGRVARDSTNPVQETTQ